MDGNAHPMRTMPSGGPWLRRRVPLFTLFGFQVQIDLSWIFLALLVTWSLATAVFPSQSPGLPTATYWWMGVAGTIGLLLSLVFHELSHSLVARQFGMLIRGITLFIFGGVAEMADEPPSARAELWMALAGPAASFVFSALAWAVASLGAALGWPAPAAGVVGYLAQINLILAVFNLIPAYPLDGGRVLRAGLWWWRGDIRWATRRAAEAGTAFGSLMIGLGVLQVVFGNFIGGMWWFLIGMFLRGAAQSSYMELLSRQALVGAPVRRFMTPDPIGVRPETTLQSLVDDYIYRYHHKQFPVVDSGKALGWVGVEQVKAVPRDDWGTATVAGIAEACSDLNTVEADMDTAKALEVMTRAGAGRLLIVERGRLVGILTLKDLLAFLSLKMDLGGLEP